MANSMTARAARSYCYTHEHCNTVTGCHQAHQQGDDSVIDAGFCYFKLSCMYLSHYRSEHEDHQQLHQLDDT